MKTIRTNIRGWTALDAVYDALKVRFTYTGGTGSKGNLWALVPRLEREEGESDYVLRHRYYLEAVKAIAEVVRDREEKQDLLAESKGILKYMQDFTGRRGRGEITIR